ncbi:DNA oxidative demethylase ALKBH2-like, partial [Stegodyphus dumicola]
MDNGLNIKLCEGVLQSPDEVLKQLEKDIVYLPKENSQIRAKGKSFPIPREIAAFGDQGLTYTFSGMSISCQPWTPLLFEIKSLVEHLSGANFNFVLINRYKDGNSCIGQHKDNEPSLDSNHPVCSLSLGETRTIVFKRQQFQDYRLELVNNSLLILSSPTNELWTHGIPRQKERKGVR